MTPSAKKERQPWPGGYIHHGKKGSTYVIERRIGEQRLHVSTKCRTLRAAMKELEKFEADPFGYTPASNEGVVITEDLILEYAKWMREAKRNSADWIKNVSRFLEHWQEDLGGKDLRRLHVQRDLKAALNARKTSRKHRIEAIKAFCGWLRREKGLMKMAEDATLDLAVPQATAEKLRRKKVVRQEDVKLLLEHGELEDEARDVLILQTGTAWHLSEVKRFAKDGEIIDSADRKQLAILVTLHKSGEPISTPIVTKEHLAAAERIRKRGALPSRFSLFESVLRGVERVRAWQKRELELPDDKLLPDIRLGWMRHSVLTWAIEMGATPQQVSEFAGHRSVATTRKFYIDTATATVSVPVLRLVKG